MGMAIAMIVVMGEGEIVGIEYDPFHGGFGCTDAINRRLYNQNSFSRINFGDVLDRGGSYRRDKSASVRAGY